eukprot:g1092.t1
MSNCLNSLKRFDVHRLCSAQVIASPAFAVKELIENALDAGGDNIEIRLTEYGIDRIEVRDNGCGINPEQFSYLSKKHHTSKLEAFSDLEHITSFGFRGEALSSLCCVSDVVIITRSKSSEIGHRLEFDNEGEIQSKSLESREIGTSVILTNFFKNLPVREKELRRNTRKEYNQLLRIVQSYALVSTQIKILCTNQLKQKAPAVVVSTIAAGSLLENITCIFGSKTVDTLAPLDIAFPHGELIGFISKSPEESSRVSGERQFFFMNQRPVEIPKIKKLLNSIYRSECCASKTYPPVLFLHFLLPQNRVDVNLTPDKQSVLIQDEPEIIEIMQMKILELWEQNRSVFKTNTQVESKAGRTEGINFFLEPTEETTTKEEEKEEEEKKDIDISFITPVKLMSTENSIIKSEVKQTATVLKRKAPEMEFEDDTVFKRKDVGDLGPTPQQFIPKLNLGEIKKKLTQRKTQSKSPHHYKVNHPSIKLPPGTPTNLQGVFSEDKVDQEMDRIFNKASFQDLDVIGQFNLGFILAKHHSDVYIIDQHSSDEKSTFENLMETTQITRQPLISPLSLHLSAVEADVIRSHIYLFDLNGFQFDGIEDMTNELKLIAVPCSQNQMFTEADLFELIQKIQSEEFHDSQPPSKKRRLEQPLLNGGIPRPDKVRSMLAMRACRASVMIGSPLTLQQMIKIVHRYSAMESLRLAKPSYTDQLIPRCKFNLKSSIHKTRTRSEHFANSIVRVVCILAGVNFAVAAGTNVDSFVDGTIEVVKTTGEVVKRGIDIVIQGTQVVQKTIPIVQEKIDQAAPVAEKVSKTASDATSTALTAASPVLKSAGKAAAEFAAGQGINLEAVKSGTQTVVQTASDAVTVATPAVKTSVNFLTTTEPIVLGYYAIGAFALYFLGPSLLSLTFESLRGYAGDISAPAALDCVLSEEDAVMIDIRTADEKDRSGVLDIPKNVSSRLVELEFAFTEKRKLRAQLRNPENVESRITALQIAALRRVAKSTFVYLLDRNGSLSKKVAKCLKTLGYSRCFVISGGYAGWLQAKLQTKPSTSVFRAEVVAPVPVVRPALRSGTTQRTVKRQLRSLPPAK